MFFLKIFAESGRILNKVKNKEKTLKNPKKPEIAVYAYKYRIEYNILCSGTRCRKRDEKRIKKSKKRLEKGVDKRKIGWYYSEAVA